MSMPVSPFVSLLLGLSTEKTRTCQPVEAHLSARVQDVDEGALRSDEDEHEHEAGRCRDGAGDGKHGGSGAQIPRERSEQGRGRITGKVMSNDDLDFGVLCVGIAIVAHAPLGRVV